MAGALVKLDQVIASDVATVTLGDASNYSGSDNWSTDYNVYKIVVENYKNASDNKFANFKFIDSGSTIVTGNYKVAQVAFKNNATYEDGYGVLNNGNLSGHGIGNDTAERLNAVVYLFAFNKSDKFSYATYETSYMNTSGNLFGLAGGTVSTDGGEEVHKGVQFYSSSGNIESGTFTLFGLSK